MTLIAYTNKKTLPTRWVAQNAPFAARLDTLREAGLIETERAGFNGANRFYIPFAVRKYFSTDDAAPSADRK